MEKFDLKEKSQLSDIIKQSETLSDGVVILKHSTRCAISSMVWSRFQRNWQASSKELPVYYLDIIRYRELSNLVSETFEVAHESPQVLLIKNGKCVYHASHNSISPDRVMEQAQYA
ncbi:MAG: bacillithiol system redox-active protein YtxJ [Owenweeksia sp.]|nr:bacillithiol system redox-active protein YtxJ [Owenweeksia sp.]